MKTIKITKSQYDEIAERSRSAQEFLEAERFGFILRYISNSLESITTAVLNNTVKSVSEEITISDSIKRIFATPKKVQVDELSGQYKWLSQFLNDMAYYASELPELERKIADGSVTIE